MIDRAMHQRRPRAWFFCGGAGKYPDEDYYNAFLNSNGGSSNAFTSDEVCVRKASY